MSRTLVLAALAALSLSAAAPSSPAWAQANLRPDPTPRLPPQPGQSLPAEDAEFLGRATALSDIERQLGDLAGKAQSPEVQQLGRRIAETHGGLGEHAARIAQERNVTLSQQPLTPPGEGGPGGAAGAVTAQAHASTEQVQAVTQRLAGLSGPDLDRAWVEEQLRLHSRLADLYQTQASHTGDTALAKFAITALTTIQKDRDALRRLAPQFGIAAADVEGQAPQYGDASTARQDPGEGQQQR